MEKEGETVISAILNGAESNNYESQKSRFFTLLGEKRRRKILREKKIYNAHRKEKKDRKEREREKVYISRNINLFWKTELEPPRTRAKMAAVNSAQSIKESTPGRRSDHCSETNEAPREHGAESLSRRIESDTGGRGNESGIAFKRINYKHRGRCRYCSPHKPCPSMSLTRNVTP